MANPQPLQQSIIQKNGLVDLVWSSYFQSISSSAVSTPPNTPLTPDEDVQTDSNGDLVSVANTGTNNNVMSTSPTFDSKITVTTDVDTATVSASGLITSGSLNTGDITANDITAVDVTINDLTANDLNVNDITGNDLFVNDINANDVITNDLTVDGLTTTNGGKIQHEIEISVDYTLLSSDEIIYCNTDGGAFTVTLPPLVDGSHYRIVNTGTSGYDVTLSPSGTDKLFSVNASELVHDLESFDLNASSTKGWL